MRWIGITSGAAALVVTVAVVGPIAPLARAPTIGVASNAAALNAAGSDPASATARRPKIPPSVEFIGDSTALLTGAGVNEWGFATGKMRVLGWSADANHWLGCGVVQAGFVRYGGEITAAAHECGDMNQEWSRVLDATRPDAVVLQFGPWDVADHLLPGDSVWRAPGDPLYDQQLLAAMTSITQLSLRRHIETVWLTSPHIVVPRTSTPPSPPLPEDDPARMDRFNTLLRKLARRRPGVHIIDLARFVQRSPGGDYNATLRPDGIHFTFASTRTVGDWLGPQILSVLRHAQFPRRRTP